MDMETEGEGPISTPTTHDHDSEVEAMDTAPPSSSEGMGGTPVQILDFKFSTNEDDKRTSTLVLKKDALDNVLKKAGDREIVFISIAGPSRRGKSFLLGFMLRFLNAVEADETDWIGWDDPKKPLTGFKWRNGYDRETSGMWVWSEPFIVKMEDGKDCAVLIMDTQGVFDEYTSQREWSTIVGLSLLTSSCLIFNMLQDIQEDSFQMLDNFIQYGLLACENSGDVKPFQKLVFLLRDWNNPSQFNYGAKGGADFIAKKLEDKPHLLEDSRRVRRNIQECFEDVECFLMPAPGEAAKRTDYDGSLHGLDKKFATNVEKFITSLLSQDELKVKTIGGVPVKASNLSAFLEKYTEIFNSEEMPKPLTILEATARITNQNLVVKAKEVYKVDMQKRLRGNGGFVQDKALVKHHQDALKKAEKSYASAKKMGDSAIVQEYLAILQQEIQDELVKYKESNQNKKEQALRRGVEENVAEYRSKILREIEDDDFLEPAEFESKSNEQKEVFTKEFVASMNLDEDDAVLAPFLQSLCDNIAATESSLRDKNNLLRTEAEQHNENCVQLATQSYKVKVEPLLVDCQYVNATNFEDFSKKEIKGIQTKFSKDKDRKGNRKFQKKFEAKLSENLETAHESFAKLNERNREEVELRMEKLIVDCVGRFKDSMKSEFDSRGFEILPELETISSQHELAATETFNSNLVIPNTEINEKFLETFNEKLKISRTEFQEQCAQKKKELDAEIEAACRGALEEFEQLLKEHVNKFCALLEFDEIGKKAKDQILEEYKEKVKDMPIPNKDEEYEKLAASLDASAATLTEQLRLKIENAELQAKNLVTECKDFYQKEMLPFVTDKLVSSEDKLEEIHGQTKADAKKKFLEDGGFSDADEFTKSFLDEITAGTDEAYDQLLEHYRLKKDESQGVVKTALQDAKKYYHEEMEKHVQASLFLEPIVLENCHASSKKIAIKSCAGKITLTSDQEKELSDEMDVLFVYYKNQNDMNTPTDPAIGIDLGTTYSCVAVYVNGKVHVIPNNEGRNTTPSFVSFNDTCELVGGPAKDQAHVDPENTIFDAKRLIGRKIDDEKVQKDMKTWPFTVVEEGGVPKIEARGKTYHPEQISAFILGEMKKMATEFLKCEVKNAVITVPAYFTDGQKQATIDAGTLAGLTVLKIIHEPTSAAVAYRVNSKTDECSRNVLIFDLGGGTFDVAVLTIKGDNIDVKAINGNTHLGGEDFDSNIVDYCVEQHLAKTKVNLLAGRNSANVTERHKAMKTLRRLRNVCELRKCDLSSGRKVDIVIDAIDGSTDLAVPLTRDKFEELNQYLFNDALEIVQNVLVEAKIEKKAIDDIVLVGGSTRIPKVQQMLTEFFEGKALDHTVNQDEAVAFGAAVQAAILNGTIAQKSGDYTKLSEVTPRSLGVETFGGELSVIIPKSTSTPTVMKEIYKTAHDNQKSVEIVVYEGENTVAVKNHLLGKFKLDGVPPAPQGEEEIQVDMKINDQGILHVTALCVSNGKTKDLTITENKLRLTKDAINKMLSDGQARAV